MFCFVTHVLSSVRGAGLARSGMISWCPRAPLSCPGGDSTMPGPQQEDKVSLWRSQHQETPWPGCQQDGGRGSEGDWECSLGRAALRAGKCMDAAALGEHKELRTAFVLVLPSSREPKGKCWGNLSFHISCSEQNPFAIATRIGTEKWKISPSVQPNLLSAFPSSTDKDCRGYL